jgi:hypothetical protein
MTITLFVDLDVFDIIDDPDRQTASSLPLSRQRSDTIYFGAQRLPGMISFHAFVQSLLIGRMRLIGRGQAWLERGVAPAYA